MTNVGNLMTKIWKLGCGDEVKGEGYILTHIAATRYVTP